MEKCKSVATPMVVNDKFNDANSYKLIDPSIYRSLIGSLLYARGSRPDIMFLGTLDLGLHFKYLNEVKLYGYSDSDYAGDVKDFKSTSGYVFFLRSAAFSWNTKKQQVVAQYTAKAEYIAAAATINQGVWLRKLLLDLKFNQQEATELFLDSKSAIAIGKNPVNHGRTKHINVKFHAVREAEKLKEVKFSYCNSNKQVADIFTTALPKERFEDLRLMLVVCKASPKEDC
ncbi:Cysteine-rich RLK (RECEPTOR-like protein kinase) 8 [Theobroma cacao]|uniref:Cysteine-rich RLK (RECEPTOR-like protein kinase) 8 n=1 Tax=Theobroma cacao TaxID=3641 RepID=A0A061FG00_THECC|nr:Cysteine-rich RLK (RECEPTOR-like protein kinase) 8 [Theobroma cacao]